MSEPSPQGKISFAAFVLSLAHTAAVHFGDVEDPVTGAAGRVRLRSGDALVRCMCVDPWNE